MNEIHTREGISLRTSSGEWQSVWSGASTRLLNWDYFWLTLVLEIQFSRSRKPVNFSRLVHSRSEYKVRGSQWVGDARSLMHEHNPETLMQKRHSSKPFGTKCLLLAAFSAFCCVFVVWGRPMTDSFCARRSPLLHRDTAECQKYFGAMA